MNDELKKKIVRIFTGVILVMILGFGVFTVYPKYQRSRALKVQEAELLRQIERQKAEIAQLKSYQARFRSDPEFVELIARQNRRVYPGEFVFVFENPPSAK